MMRKLIWFFAVVIALLTGGCSDNDLLDSLEEDAQYAENHANFQWVRANDVETRSAFLRNFGLGYSYDAVRGSYCDWEDIRCQVVERNKTLQLQKDIGQPLVNSTIYNSIETSGTFSYSFRDYVANVALDTHQKIDIGLYNGEKRNRSFFIEDGIQEKFFYSHNEKLIRVTTWMGDANVRSLYKAGYKDVLTISFRNSIEHLKQTDDRNYAAVDSFIKVWGTHVITGVSLGGRLNIDLMNDWWRYSDKSKEERFTTEEFLKLTNSKDETRTGKEEFKWLEHGRLNIMARGGDQSSLTNLLGEHKPDGTRTFSIEGIQKWRKTVIYNPEKELESNVEMVDMTVVPIWEFAEAVDHFVALRLKAAILQDAALQQELLGDFNFFDTKFPIRYATASCQYQAETGSWKTISRTDNDAEPMVVNIVSRGRYVATVCHENIEGHSLWVCYPIYEGRLKLPCGLGVADDNSVFQVKWIGNTVTLTPKEEKASDVFYINFGEVGVSAQEGITYDEAHAMPYAELSGGVLPDGNYSATAYNVTKQGADFILSAPDGLNDIVGFAAIGDGKYKRKENYYYIYNQNEIRYE